MKRLNFILLLLLAQLAYAQTNYAYKTFNDTRIVNGHSVETNTEGVMTFIIAHRFGKTVNDANQLWGLDGAQMRMGLQYGITNNLMIGMGRNSNDKTLDAFFKYKLLTQSSGDKNMPITLTLLGYGALKPQLNKTLVEYNTKQKLSSSAQLLIGRKVSEKLSLQIMPTYLHRNLVKDEESNDLISLGSAVQWQALKNWSFTAEYYMIAGDQLDATSYTESLCLGFQINTKGHVFQFNVGNSPGLTERRFIAETDGSWEKGQLYFGFNITRDFKVKGRRVR